MAYSIDGRTPIIKRSGGRASGFAESFIQAMLQAQGNRREEDMIKAKEFLAEREAKGTSPEWAQFEAEYLARNPGIKRFVGSAGMRMPQAPVDPKEQMAMTALKQMLGYRDAEQFDGSQHMQVGAPPPQPAGMVPREGVGGRAVQEAYGAALNFGHQALTPEMLKLIQSAQLEPGLQQNAAETGLKIRPEANTVYEQDATTARSKAADATTRRGQDVNWNVENLKAGLAREGYDVTRHGHDTQVQVAEIGAAAKGGATGAGNPTVRLNQIKTAELLLDKVEKAVDEYEKAGPAQKVRAGLNLQNAVNAISVPMHRAIGDTGPVAIPEREAAMALASPGLFMTTVSSGMAKDRIKSTRQVLATLKAQIENPGVGATATVGAAVGGKTYLDDNGNPIQGQ